MKVARFAARERTDYGIVMGERIASKKELEEVFSQNLPEDIMDFISDANVRNIVEKKVSSIDHASLSISLAEVKLLAPIPRPPKIICLGLNYSDHAAEQRLEPPKEPVIFLKPRTALSGPFEDVVYPSIVKELDYEGELAVVMGGKAKKVTPTESMKYIFGFMVFNDVSARDIQFRDRQWTRGKSFDTFAPTGPWVVSREQVGDHDDLRIITKVNGEVRQNSSTGLMYLKVPEIVSSLSHVMTLEPGDIIATGTPSGVGFAIKPTPKFLSVGDVVDVEIERIGTIRNKVVAESSSSQL